MRMLAVSSAANKLLHCADARGPVPLYGALQHFNCTCARLEICRLIAAHDGQLRRQEW